MQLNSIFSISVGTASLAEHLTPARELFVENKDIFEISAIDPNTRTTLQHYTNPPTVAHKDSEKLDTIKTAIEIKAREYAKACGYDTYKYRLKVSNIWFNEMVKDSKHIRHYHYGANISGCFYVDMPENCGQIIFSHPFLTIDTLGIMGVDKYTPANSSSWSFSPKEGDVFFWKSDLQHEVPISTINGTRRCIAFDIVVTR